MQAQQAPAASPVPLQARRRLATVAQASAIYPAFTQAALRDLIFRAADRINSRGERIKGNGLSAAGAVVRIGRKVMLDLDAFESWIDEHSEALQ